jgi:small GTP-binding protein
MNEVEKIKIFTLGNRDVGKSCFIIRYTEDKFQETYLMTVGFDVKIKDIVLNDKKYKIAMYDTAGQERFKSMVYNVIKNADGIILIFSITSQDSFDSIAEWMKNIREVKPKEFPVVLLGNKIDLEESRVISKQEGEELAQKYELSFYETSNKTGENIEKSCLDLINKIIIEKEKQKEEEKKNNKNQNKNNTNEKKKNIKLDKKNEKKTSNCSC